MLFDGVGCPKGCSGNGECMSNGKCDCNKGWYGDACADVGMSLL